MLASSIRMPERGPLDVPRTAARLAIRLTIVPRLDAVGLCLGDDEVVLDRRLGPGERRAVFAHEVGHIVLRRGVLLRGLRADEETLADQFGDEMVVPSDELVGLLPIPLTRAAESFGVPSTRVASQLARLGAIPPLSRLGSGEVVCRRCGDRRSLECRCLYYKVNGDKAVKLPLAV